MLDGYPQYVRKFGIVFAVFIVDWNGGVARNSRRNQAPILQVPFGPRHIGIRIVSGYRNTELEPGSKIDIKVCPKVEFIKIRPNNDSVLIHIPARNKVSDPVSISGSRQLIILHEGLPENQVLPIRTI